MKIKEDSLAGLEDRRAILAEYYAVPMSLINALVSIRYGNERKLQCKAHGIDPYIFRTMLDYTRYPEASLLIKALAKARVDFRGLRVLDFGCLVADYGISFARLHAQVAIYDTPAAIQFAKFRFEREQLQVVAHEIPEAPPRLVAGQNLVVFGEVLEHLADPLSVLIACSESVDYIFTSCYPFGDETYFAQPGHLKSAQLQQPECLSLLTTKYFPLHLKRKAYLWCSRHLAER